MATGFSDYRHYVMLCRNPYIGVGGLAFGCGQCMPCRHNRRRLWTHRIMLEAAQYSHNAFVTLTYSEDEKPLTGDGLGTLKPEDYQLWIKRLRDRVSPSTFRFFLVGEYGDETWRPHYHAGLFGFPSCVYGESRYGERRKDCCYWCDLVRDTWGKGNVYLGVLEADSAGYMAGYVSKSMTKWDDERLQGRHPEFARMSNGGGKSGKGGIGKDALWDIADILLKYDLDKKLVDVPSSLGHGRKKYPLGPYLRRCLREIIGRDRSAPQEVYDEIAEALRPLREAARESKTHWTLKSQIVKEGKQAVLNMESRRKVRRGRRAKWRDL